MKKWIFTHDRTDLLKTIPNDKSSTMEKGIRSCMEPSSRRTFKPPPRKSKMEKLVMMPTPQQKE